MKFNEIFSKLWRRNMKPSRPEQNPENRGSYHTHHRQIRNPYDQFLTTHLILRDQLAIDRTVLANERTFMSYCRTSLALIFSGAGSIRFFDMFYADVAGWFLIALGLIVAVIGSLRFIVMNKKIRTTRKLPVQNDAQGSGAVKGME
jgi:putative membrane protein